MARPVHHCYEINLQYRWYIIELIIMFMLYFESNQAVAAINSEWWGSVGGAPSGVQGQSPWSGGQRGIAP